MKEKITFKSFFSTMWRGIVQAFRWVQKVLGFRGRAKYVKVLRGVVGTCLSIWLAVLTLAMLYNLFDDSVDGFIARNISGKGCYNDVRLSENVYFQKNWYDDYGRIYDFGSGEVTVNRVDWVVMAGDDDSLAVYSKRGKRGYINRFTGEIAVPARYDRAWVFSDGLAAVEKEGCLMFINHEGETVLSGSWHSSYDHDIVFKDGLCVVCSADFHRFGIIDKTGAWVLEPEYDYIRRLKGLWVVGRDERYGVLDGDMKELLPVVYEDISFEDDFITAQPYLEPTRSYTYDGRLLNDCVYDNVSHLYYEAEQETCGEMVYTLAPCYKYSVEISDYDYRYGLLDSWGRAVTEPLYDSIEAIGPDLYFCRPHGIIINSKGHRIE